jgi:tRNA (guanine37-N1)-methyltransferase
MTLFPEMIETVTDESIIGRAKKKGVFHINTHQIRDFSLDKHRRVDDTPYGGGMGMIMSVPPVAACHEAIMKNVSDGERIRTVYMSPQGALFNQKTAERIAKDYDRVIILCGHYEGVDNRIIETVIDEEISIGDYVITGGELAALIVIDCVCRLIDGTLSSPECHENESISCGMLEYPQYTRPAEFNGLRVPAVLLGGNHAEIERFRYKAALEKTKKLRSDLL